VASLSQGRTAAAQCGLFTHKSVPVIFEPPCSLHFLQNRTTLFSEWSCFSRTVTLTVSLEQSRVQKSFEIIHHFRKLLTYKLQNRFTDFL